MENSDSIESAKTRVFSIKYIRIIRWCMRTSGSWPGESFGEKVHFLVPYIRTYLLIQHGFCTLGIMLYVVKYHNIVDFFVVEHCFYTSFLGIVVIIRGTLSMFKNFAVVTKRFFLSFHLVHFRHKGPYYEKMYSTIDRLSYYFTVYMVGLMIWAGMLFNISPMYQNYRSGVFSQRDENITMEFSLYISYPGVNPEDWFKSITIFNVIITYYCAVYVVVYDALLCNMVFQIIGHILILTNCLECLPKPQTPTVLENVNKNFKQKSASIEMYNAEENRVIGTKLSECIEHHKLIVNFTADLSSFFGPMLGVNYLFHLVSCCLLLLQCSKGDADTLLRIGPLTVIIFGQLIQISCIFEVVGTVSEKLKDYVYYIPWECMDTRNRRTVCILLHRVQTPITVTAMGMTTVGVTTMAGILKTTFTYFTFLKSMEA